MSDIGIRFDGIMLAASLALAGSIYLLVALGAALVWLGHGRIQDRSRQVARASALFAILYSAALAVLVAYLIHGSPPVTGPDWLDWLSIPSLVLFVSSCVVIARRRSILH